MQPCWAQKTSFKNNLKIVLTPDWKCYYIKVNIRYSTKRTPYQDTLKDVQGSFGLKQSQSQNVWSHRRRRTGTTDNHNWIHTIFRVSGGSDDGHGDHDQARCAPEIFHQELLQHDIPQPLEQDQVNLLGQRGVAPLQLQHLNLRRAQMQARRHAYTQTNRQQDNIMSSSHRLVSTNNVQSGFLIHNDVISQLFSTNKKHVFLKIKSEHIKIIM